MNPRSLVWLHGFTGTPDAFEPVLREYSRLDRAGLRCFAPALLGHDAGSEMTPDPPSAPEQPAAASAAPDALRESPATSPFDSELDRLAAWLRSRGWQRGAVCGYSLGGRLALGLLARHPSLVSSLILLSVNPGLRSAEARRERAESDARWAELLRSEGLGAFYLRWQDQPLFSTQRRLSAQAQHWQARLRARHQPAGLARCLERCGLAQMPDYRDVVRASRVPIRWAAGSLDQKFCSLVQEMAASHAHSTIEIVDRAGHNLVLEAPAAVAQMLHRHARD